MTAGGGGQWEPLVAFKPESNMLKSTSLQDCLDCRKKKKDWKREMMFHSSFNI